MKAVMPSGEYFGGNFGGFYCRDSGLLEHLKPTPLNPPLTADHVPQKKLDTVKGLR